MTSQPRDIARKFQSTQNAHAKRDSTREMNVINYKWYVMPIKCLRTSHAILFL